MFFYQDLLKHNLHLLENWTDIGPKLAKKLCDRKFGVGADGLILVYDIKHCASSKFGELTTIAMKNPQSSYGFSLYNADGSMATISGNGMLCAVSVLSSNVANLPLSFAVATVNREIIVGLDNLGQAKVSLGKPLFNSSDIPVTHENSSLIGLEVLFDGYPYTITCVNLGNPHCVVCFDEELLNFENDYLIHKLNKLGQLIQNHKMFIDGVNVEFVQKKNDNELVMYVVERGVGPTLACGTGAGASVVAMIALKKIKDEALVSMLGGQIKASWSGNINEEVIIFGKAHNSFIGFIDLNNFFAKL